MEKEKPLCSLCYNHNSVACVDQCQNKSLFCPIPDLKLVTFTKGGKLGSGKTGMTVEKARLILIQEKPDLVMEISEYLSFADVEYLVDEEVIKDFEEYMEK